MVQMKLKPCGSSRNGVASFYDRMMDVPTDMGSMFMDSGAHGLYNRHAKKKGVDGYNLRTSPELLRKRYAFYESKEFYDYCDQYASFIKEHAEAIDFYVNVDAIFHPEYSYRTLKYLEQKHGLKPIPVIHYNTPLEWVEKHLADGYKFIGLGGLGQDATTNDYIKWANGVYNLICDQPSRNPLVKTHGFAMTSWRLMRRYPWWSVDSASWIKAAGYGRIFVPQRRHGKFVFSEKPYVVMMSDVTNFTEYSNVHYKGYTKLEQQAIEAWLEFLGIPLGKTDPDGTILEEGVMNTWWWRARVNLMFFEHFVDSVPPWPWAFRTQERRGFFV
jgi:hypothetical protein